MKERDLSHFILMLHAESMSEFTYLHQKNWRQQAVRKFGTGLEKPNFQFTGFLAIDFVTYFLRNLQRIQGFCD
jgi:hypothetical protein